MYVFRSRLLVIDKWPLPHMVLVIVTALPPNPTTAYVEPKQTRSEQGQLLRARERPGAPIWRAVYGEKQAASTKQSPIKDVCAHPFYLFCRTTKMNWTLLTKKIIQTKIMIQCAVPPTPPASIALPAARLPNASDSDAAAAPASSIEDSGG